MSNILEDQPVEGMITVTSRSNSGTLQADRFPGTIGEENPLVRERQDVRMKLGQRARGRHEEVAGICQCPMPSLKRGNPSRACVTCGKTVA